MDKTLDQLLEEEARAAEELSQAYIRFSVARVATLNKLSEIREGLPNVFSGEFDYNEVPHLRIT